MIKDTLRILYWKILSGIRKRTKLLSTSASMDKDLGGFLISVKRNHSYPFNLSNDHESWLDAAYSASLATKSGAFVDVGVNRGQTLIKILSMDSKRQYVGFEPQIDCVFFIEHLIKHNKLINHAILPIGLSNQSEVKFLFKRHDNGDGTASMVEGFRPSSFYTMKYPMYVARGDEVFVSLALPDISVIKVDVEGGELEVIEGLTETLDRFSPFVFFEVLNDFLVATGETLDAETISFREARTRKLESIVRDLGNEIFNVLPNNKLKIISKIEPLVSDDLTITDYVAVHTSHLDPFLKNFNGEVLR